MKFTLHFKRRKNTEGRHQFYSLSTTTTSSSSASQTPMCSSPSHLQQPHQEEYQANESPQTLEPINPINQPEPDQENPHQEKSNLDRLQQQNDLEQEEEEEDQEDQENPGIILSAFPPPPSSIDVVVADVRMPSLNPPKRLNKRKKGKGSLKKQLTIQKKLHTLLENLKPVPFIPSKILDFTKHEKLLKRLGLWDFFHIEFDRNIRSDLIAQLIATYDPKLRCSYVNEFRIAVNRADLARAFKLPVKKEKSGNLVAAEGVDLDFEALSEESISFIEGFVSNWVLLHEDTWMMPNEVLNWTKAIKDGHPEKVDWAGLFWFMVEKELLKGEQLVDCYYASHLQYLIKSQREEVMVREPREGQDMVDLDTEEEEEVLVREEQDKVELDGKEDVVAKEQDRVELDVEKVVLMAEQDMVELNPVVKKEGDGGNDVGDVTKGDLSEVPEQENDVLVGPNIELTLGQDVGEKEDVKVADVMDVEERREDEEQQDEEQQEKEQEHRQWLLHGRNNVGEHFMQPCNMEDASGFDSLEERQEEGDELEGEREEEEEDGEEEEEDGFDVGPHDDTLEGDGLTGNFLQAMETTQITYGSQGHLHDDSSVDLVADRNDLQHMAAGGPSFYGNTGKRELDHDHEVSHQPLNGSNKRLRIDGPWDNKPLDFGTCMDQMQQLMGRARLMYQEKVQAQEQASFNQQILLNEVQKRDSMIEHLHKSKCEEIQKRDAEIYRLQRELYLMGNILEDYRKALKQTNKAFAEYRLKCQLPEEPIYKDAGLGGVVLTTAEIEKQRLKEEEEYRLACLILEQKAKAAEEGYAFQFGEYLNKVVWLDKRLADLEKGVEELRDYHSKAKVSETEQKAGENSEFETEQKVIVTSAFETDQKIVEVSECGVEKVVETSETETEEKVVETLQIEAEEKVVETSQMETKEKAVETSEMETKEKAAETSEMETEEKVVKTSECPPSG
ncbi:uncharacterized protein LOC113771811 [Coffea eugenioides]|uniref:uncharacterized protein LOC113771811 n=1 Tax=Coffea eugenioides TaxID=49369 RepID=UPI000F613929|nr:uncharacterized protein LOC113771811 [Coffea eugenioides]